MEKASVDGIVGTLAGMKEREDSMEFLKTLDLPVLVLHGSEDQLIPVAEAEAMAKIIPGAEMKVIAQAGHLLNMEQPEAFNGALREFVKKF